MLLERVQRVIYLRFVNSESKLDMFKIYQLEVISWKLIVHIMRCDIFNWLQFLLTLISLLKVFNVKIVKKFYVYFNVQRKFPSILL